MFGSSGKEGYRDRSLSPIPRPVIPHHSWPNCPIKSQLLQLNALQADLDEWMLIYNEQRTHQGRWCFGKTPMQTFLDSAAAAPEKQNLARAA